MESQLKDHGFKSQSEFWLFESQHLGSSPNLNHTVSPPVGKENPGWHPVPLHCGLVSTQSPSTEGSLAPSPLQAGYHPVPQHWGLVCGSSYPGLFSQGNQESSGAESLGNWLTEKRGGLPTLPLADRIPTSRAQVGVPTCSSAHL